MKTAYAIPDQGDLKAARIEAARRTEEHVEQPKTSQHRDGLDMELELLRKSITDSGKLYAGRIAAPGWRYGMNPAAGRTGSHVGLEYKSGAATLADGP